ncbi:SDR family NAD(P)-dependent oxidoreductase [Rickettsiales bacterium]|nr:SDR family NAD(P)-dependent oxidoreductase [Rickettsiales bacterium]
MGKKLLEGKIAVVTGASRGIGAAICKRYAKEGAHVVMVARSVNEMESVDDEIQEIGGSATIVPLDLQDFDKIDQLGAGLMERFGKIDILVGNAGVLGGLSPIDHIDPKIWQNIFDVNVTANYRLLRSLTPLLKQSDAGRALFVSSDVARGVVLHWGAYAASKAALEKMVEIYAAENEHTNIRAAIVDPGAVATAMMNIWAPGADQEKLTKPDEITDIFVELLLEDSDIEEGGVFYAQNG